MEILKKNIGRFPFGVWIAVVAILCSFLAWIMQFYSLLNWEGAIRLGIQNESFSGDAVEKALANVERGIAWADLLILFPLFISGTIGVLSGQIWGYVLWFALGMLSIYFSILFWVLEKEYTYPTNGPLAYYTYFWGFFLYWGIGAAICSAIQIIN